MSFYYARVNYKNVIGSNLETRSAFDGSVPYCVSCSTVLSQAASEADVTSSAYFSIIGQATSSPVEIASAHDGLVKQCGVNLTDMSFVLSGTGLYTLRITVCDPTDFPSSAAHTYLYENTVYVGGDATVTVKVPDITGIVIVGNSDTPLNACAYVATYGTEARNISFHGVASVDD